MSKRKDFYKKRLKIAAISSVLLAAGCGTPEEPAVEPAAENGQTEAEEQDKEEAEVAAEPDDAEEAEAAEADHESAEETEMEEVSEDQAQIGTVFPLGTPLSEVVDYYGPPTYDEFFMGARLVGFDVEEGYFLESDETVSGFMVSGPDIPIFDAHVGMTFAELDAVLPNSGDVVYEGTETQDYTNIYYKEGFKMMFYADTEDGPTEYVFIVRGE